MEREEAAALEKARRIKDAMRQVEQSLDPRPGNLAKRPAKTGISDGTWYSERLKKIEQPPEKRLGFMERVGEGLDSWATKGTREDRPWEVDEPKGFRPLQSIGKLASQVGEKAQGLVSLPQNRSSREERPRQEPEAEQGSEERVGRTVVPQEKPVGQDASPKPNASDSPERSGPSLGERVSNRLHVSARRENKDVGSASAAAPYASSTPVQSISVPSEPERRETKRTVPSEPRVATVGSSASQKPRASTVGSSSSQKPGGLEKFELEDVVPSAGPQSGVKGGRGARHGVRGGRTESMPEPSGPLAADASLFVIRGNQGEFYPFGSDGSTSVPLPPGTLVRVTKPGSEWSGVETADGGRGIIRTEQIRRAHEGEVAAGRVPERRAEPAKRPALPGSPIPLEIRKNVSEPEPAARRDAPKMLGDGLLPPLMDDR